MCVYYVYIIIVYFPRICQTEHIWSEEVGQVDVFWKTLLDLLTKE